MKLFVGSKVRGFTGLQVMGGGLEFGVSSLVFILRDAYTGKPTPTLDR